MKTLIPLTNFLAVSEKVKLLEYANKAEWITHYSTVSGTKTPLEFTHVTDEIRKHLFLYYGTNVKLMLSRLHPNTIQDWHTDGKKNKRTTVVIHPLTDDYAPLHVHGGASNGAVILNTQERHKIINNDNMRINFQICYDENIEEVSVYWKNYQISTT